MKIFRHNERRDARFLMRYLTPLLYFCLGFGVIPMPILIRERYPHGVYDPAKISIQGLSLIERDLTFLMNTYPQLRGLFEARFNDIKRSAQNLYNTPDSSGNKAVNLSQIEGLISKARRLLAEAIRVNSD